MGKGNIIEGGTSGYYNVTSILNPDRIVSELADLDAKIIIYEEKIAAASEGLSKNVLKAMLFSLQCRKVQVETHRVETEALGGVWCADLTENITGDVGLIEVPGESVAYNIQPGYEGNAAYDAVRDGQLIQTMFVSPEAAFYNIAMLPGWQKWKPTFRYGTITAISGSTADVTLEAALSTQQDLNINQTDTLEAVSIEYMDCDGVAFSDGDDVLVKFENQNWDTPKIIGFKDNPKACYEHIYIIGHLHDTEVYCLVWDIANNAYATTIPLNAGGFASFPCKASAISAWKADRYDVGSPAFQRTTLSPLSERPPAMVWDVMSDTVGRYCNPGTGGHCCQNWCEYGTDPPSDSEPYYSAVGTGTLDLDVVDHEGNSGQYVFGTVDMSDLAGRITNQLWTHDFSCNAPNFPGNLLTPLTTGDPRSWSLSAEITEEMEDNRCDYALCYVWGEPGAYYPQYALCDGLKTWLDRDKKTIAYEVHSPFSDNASKYFTTESEGQIELGGKSVGTCNAGSIKETITGGQLDVKSMKSDQQMVFFYVEEIVITLVESVCAQPLYGSSYRACNDAGTSWAHCTDEMREGICTNYRGIEFSVTAFTHIVDDEAGEVIADVNPFEVSENPQLGAAILNLKNYVHSFSESPPDQSSKIWLFLSLLS